MSYIAHEINLDEGITVRIKQDEIYLDFFDENDIQITYRNNSRVIVGTQAVSDSEFKDLLRQAKRGEILCLDVYAYNHTNLSVSTTPFSCQHAYWDSGLSGIVYITREKLLERYGKKRVTKQVKEKGLLALKSTVELFDHYLNGNVWYYSITDEQEDVLDSCGGYIGESELCLAEALESAEEIIKNIKKTKMIEVSEVDYWNARDVVTLKV